MKIRSELRIDLDESERFEAEDYRMKRKLMVDHITISNQLPTSVEVACFGKLLRKDGAPMANTGLAQMRTEDLPEPILNELKRRGAIQSRIGTVKRHRGSEVARQAALG